MYSIAITHHLCVCRYGLYITLIGSVKSGGLADEMAITGMTRANYPRYLSALSSSTPKCIRFCQRVSFSAIFIQNIMNNTLIKTSSPNSCFTASVSSPSRTFSPPSPYTPSTIHHRDMRRHCPTMPPQHSPQLTGKTNNLSC